MATQVYPYLMRYPLSKLETRGLLSGVIFENGAWQKKSRPGPGQTRAEKQRALCLYFVPDYLSPLLPRILG